MNTYRIMSLTLLLAFCWPPLPLLAGAPEMRERAPQPLSLLTATPEEGFQVAIRLSRLGVTETQSDREVLFQLREIYSLDPDALIASSHVIAVHFQTVAAANNYWRETPENMVCNCGAE